jgi:hypothetical protein
VSTTLDGLSSLPHRIHWQAMPGVPASQVSEVDFLIDGQLSWVEYAAPYFYGNDGNYLVTSFLMPGEHTFTTRMLTIGGQIATETVKAMVVGPPPAPPAGLAGTWARTVTAADMMKAEDKSTPVGDWQLTVSAVGWETRDPNAALVLLDVAYQSAGAVEMRWSIEHPPYPNPEHGGFCYGLGPDFAWTLALGEGGKTLALHPVGQDPCGDRAAVFEGTWTRVGQ